MFCVWGLLIFLGLSINCIGGLGALGSWSILLVALFWLLTLISYWLLFEKLELFFCSLRGFDVEIIWGGFKFSFLGLLSLPVNFEIIGFVKRGFETFTAFEFLFFKFPVV